MKARTLRTWVWVHKWSSLVSMLFLLMLCITGLPLIFHEEIEHWLDPHPPMQAVAPGTVAPRWKAWCNGRWLRAPQVTSCLFSSLSKTSPMRSALARLPLSGRPTRAIGRVCISMSSTTATVA